MANNTMSNSKSNDMGVISSMILADMQDEDEIEQRLRRRRRKVIVPPSLRKKSRYYTRPIFKEPGSKLRTVDENGNRAEGSEKQDNRVAIIHELLGDVGKNWTADSDSDADAIQPTSRTKARLRSMVGKPSDLEGLNNNDRSWALEKRLLKRDHSPMEEFDSAASVVTCSNLDNLEGKRLKGYSFERQPSDLSTIRREVNKMVVVVLPLSLHMDKEKEGSSGEKPSDEMNVDDRDEASETSSRGNAGSSLQSVFSGGLMSMWSDASSFFY
jgi:hypothetical protein